MAKLTVDSKDPQYGTDRNGNIWRKHGDVWKIHRVKALVESD